MLFSMGAVSRMGRIQDGSTVSDYDSGEIERKMSLRLSLLNGDWGPFHFNIVDTPGYADFIGESKAALRVCDTAVVVVDSVAGVEIGTERVWGFARELGVPRMVFVNKVDRTEADPGHVLQLVRERLGRGAVPLQLPLNVGNGFSQFIDLLTMQMITYSACKANPSEIPPEHLDAAVAGRNELIEAVAETDEALMERYFSEGDLSAEDLTSGLRQAVARQQVVPVLCGDALNNVGVPELLAAIAKFGPTPGESAGLRYTAAQGEEVVLEASAEAPLAAFVFKTISEQHVGDLTLLRLYSGRLTPGMEVLNSSRGTNERIGQFFRLKGHQREEIDSAEAGDIVALVKLRNTHTNDTLTVRNSHIQLPAVDFPVPLIAVAIAPTEKGGEERMATGLAQLREEDPGFVFRYDPEIRQSLLIAQGELHLNTIVERLKSRYGSEVTVSQPRIPYRETIRSKAEGHHRHKKQTGGRGQFGEVFLRVEPRPRGEGFEFGNEVVGGNIPSNFIPAVEKGVVESLDVGPLAGYRVVDVAVIVTDGKHHPVDSDEVSFKLAGSQAFRDAFLKARPILLEPIYGVTVTVPEHYMGDVMGDLSARRGRISGMDTAGHHQVIRAEVPLAELDRYSTTLRSMTQGKGMHTQEFLRYDEVPGEIQARIIEEARRAAQQS